MKRVGLVDFLGIFILGGLLFQKTNFSADPGVGWHLLSGKWILSEGRIPRIDPFLWAEAPRTWVSNQWLSDVLLYGVYSLGGTPLLKVFVTFIIAVTLLWVLTPCMRGLGLPSLLTVFPLFISLLLCRLQWFLRPVLFSFLFFAIVLAVSILWSRGNERMRKLFAFLPLIFVLWVNMHPAFPLGLLVLGAVFLDELRKAWSGKPHAATSALVVAVGAAAATLLNPYGWSLHLHMLALVGNDFFMNLNTEWFSPDFHMKVFAPLGFVFFVLFVLLARTQVALSGVEALLLVLFSMLSLSSRRYIPFLGIVLVVPLSLVVLSYWKQWEASGVQGKVQKAFLRIVEKDRRGTQGRWSFLLLVFVAGAVLFGNAGLQQLPAPALSVQHPNQSLAYLEQAPQASKIFHTPDWGGAIAWRLWPKWRPTIDDRNVLNGQRAYEEFLRIYRGKPGWSEKLAAGEFEWLLLEKKATLNLLVDVSDTWEEVSVSDPRARHYRRTQRSPQDAR